MLFPLLLLVTGCLATYDIVCDETAGRNRIDGAIQEARSMARNARDQIADLNKDTTKAAFKPLFRSSDVVTLGILYNGVINIATSDLRITFYCKPDFIDLYQDGERTLWTDTAFTYVDTQGATQSVPLFRVGAGDKPKPGLSGSSFTTIGYRHTFHTGDVGDFSNQRHIYVSKKRWDPPANDGLDHRFLDTVNQDGLKEDYTALDRLKPLSETVFHELMHALGGTIQPNKGGSKINDAPIRPINNAKIYGYEQCVWMNQNRDETAAVAIGATPLTRADCPTILAKALYLQIQGKATYWSTGDVDRETLEPAGIPPPPESDNERRAKRILRRIGITWFA
ncbi:hypothetical protein F5Y08DRAFT_312641 [Xylaria arbuscula]|nr:hypothetical protein F5Y08DRAFT_312641 [Xylaria arbuscula]